MELYQALAVRSFVAFFKLMQVVRPKGPSADAGDDSELVERARRGDRPAFDRLVEIHLPHIWATVFKMVRHREDAEDVVQEVFITAYRALPGFRGDSKLSTWLHRIAVTRSLHHLDRAETKRERASDTLDESWQDGPPVRQNPLGALEAKELMRKLADCLLKLPAAWRAILALRDSEEHSYERIAELLGIEMGTVRSRLSRARGALRECVEGRTP